MYLPDFKTADIKGKRVFLRMDLDAPVSEDGGQSTEDGQQKTENRMEVVDETRLAVGMPTLEYLLENEASVIVGGHLRRPDRYDPKLSVRPIVEWILKNIKYQISNIKYQIEETEINGFKGWKLSDNLFILENLRFYKEEKANDKGFAKKLANLADIYVDDAFAVAHRSHASLVGIPKFLPHFAGFHLQEEIRVLSEILENPKRPFIVIIGGEKIETKLPLVAKMCQLADHVLVGGKIAQEMEATKSKIKNQKSKIRCAFLIGKINDEGTDVTSESIEEFIRIINTAKTVIWNGPVGKTESAGHFSHSIASCEGSMKLAEGIIKSRAYSIVGGGDTLEFLKQINLLDKFSFFSTGGGAMLAFLSGEKLPGLEALLD